MSEANEAQQVGQPPWSEEDITWLGKIPPHLQIVAKRHGRRVFSLSMQMGGASYALGQIMRMGRGNRKVEEGVQLLNLTLNDMAQQVLVSLGRGIADVKACQTDIELVVQLAEAANEGAKRSPSGIILDS